MRTAEAGELFEHAAARAQAIASGGAHPERLLAATPTFEFPSIGPGYVTPPPLPAPATVTGLHAHAEIATPQPRGAAPVAARLAEVAAVAQEAQPTRKDKKRQRIDTPSPSPSPAPSSVRQSGAIRRSNQILRGRAALPHRQYALAPSVWMSPGSSHGRLAPSAAAAISEALLPTVQPVAGPSRIPTQPAAGPSRLLQPRRMRTAEQAARQYNGAGTRLGVVDESMAPEEPIFEDDIDIPLDLTPSPGLETFAFDLPLRPLVAESARLHETSGRAAARATGEGSNTQSMTDNDWDALLSPNDDNASLPPIQHQHAAAATPTRPSAQSAAALAAAASFQNQSQPIPIPGQDGHAPAAGSAQGTAAQLVAHHGVVPGNPGMGGGITFTPPPPGGFPEVLFSEPDGVFLGLARARIEALTAPASGSDDDLAVVLQVHNSGAPPQHEVRALTSAITAAIRQITGGLNPLVIPPERDWTPSNDRRANAPTTWAVVGLSAEEVRRILAQPTWSSTTVSFHVRLPVIEIGRFMFSAGGFAHDHNGSVLNAVFAVFVGPTVLPAIFALVQANPRFANVAPEEAVRTILASLEVRVSTLQNGNLTAAIFCDSPTQSIARWREWRDLTASLPFPSPLNSTGFARRAVPCAGCHGGDHPTHMCPFQDVPGWNAPPPGTTWRLPGAALLQGMAGQQQPPPPPPPGGSAMTRTRSQSQMPRRNNQAHPFAGPKRDNFNGGSGGFGPAGGRSGFGPGGAGAGSSALA